MICKRDLAGGSVLKIRMRDWADFYEKLAIIHEFFRFQSSTRLVSFLPVQEKREEAAMKPALVRRSNFRSFIEIGRLLCLLAQAYARLSAISQVAVSMSCSLVVLNWSRTRLMGETSASKRLIFDTSQLTTSAMYGQEEKV